MTGSKMCNPFRLGAIVFLFNVPSALTFNAQLLVLTKSNNFLIIT